MTGYNWRSSLSSVENRIRRSLGIAGPIETTLPSPLPVQPVMIVDDATRPGGNNFFRGRRWRLYQSAELQAEDTVSILGISAQSGVIIDRIWFAGHGVPIADDFLWRLYLIPNGTTLPAWTTSSDTTGPLFVEGGLSITDRAPCGTRFFTGAQAGVGGGQYIWGGMFNMGDVEMRVTPFTLECGDIYLQPGDVLGMQVDWPTGAGVECHQIVNWAGRVY